MPSEGKDGFGVALFRSVHGALAAERLLAAAGVAFKLIPVPRHIHSNCGFCVRFDWHERQRVAAVLEGRNLGLEGVRQL